MTSRGRVKIYILGWRRFGEDVYLPCGKNGIIVCNSTSATWDSGELKGVIIEFTYEDAERAASQFSGSSRYKIIELEV